MFFTRYPFRWTDEERNTVQYAVDIVKRSNLEKFGYLILTNGHNFKTKYPYDTEREFANYLFRQGQQEPELKSFLEMFKGRIFILDTELDDAQWNGNQMARLYESLLCNSNSFRLTMSLIDSIPLWGLIRNLLYVCCSCALGWIFLPFKWCWEILKLLIRWLHRKIFSDNREYHRLS